MLLIIMHKKQAYLNSILSIMREEDVDAVTLAEHGVMGGLLCGNSWDSVSFNRGDMPSEYNSALVAFIKDKDKATKISNRIKNDPSLKWANLNSDAMVCTLPFNRIRFLEKRCIK